MIKVNNNKSIIYIENKSVNKIYINGEKKIDTFAASEITDYLRVTSGNPIFKPNAVANAIVFNSDLDVAEIKTNNSVREISGRIIGVDTSYSANTMASKYILVCNFTAPIANYFTVSKRSFGNLQSEMLVFLQAGNVRQTYTTNLKSTFDFSIKYDGYKYIVSAAGYSISSENCKEQYARLELAGSESSYGLPLQNTGIRDIQAKITMGMARY